MSKKLITVLVGAASVIFFTIFTLSNAIVLAEEISSENKPLTTATQLCKDLKKSLQGDLKAAKAKALSLQLSEEESKKMTDEIKAYKKLACDEAKSKADALTSTIKICKELKKSFNKDIKAAKAKALSLQLSKKETTIMVNSIRAYKKLACDEAKIEEKFKKDGSETKIYFIDMLTIADKTTFVPIYPLIQNTSGEVKIKAGDVIIFRNSDTVAQHWPASDDHPTHTKYPGTDNGQCSKSSTPMFDACKSIKPNDIFHFQFNEKGSWGYHDHLNPEAKGTIIVE